MISVNVQNDEEMDTVLRQYKDSHPDFEVHMRRAYLQCQLHDACREGNVCRIRELMQQGADPFEHQEEECAFGIAMVTGSVEAVTALLGDASNLDTPFLLEGTSITALFLACCVGRAEMVKFLLHRKCDPNQRVHEGGTPLLQAVRSENAAELVPLLLEAGADVDMATHEGVTALMNACIIQNTETVQLLLKAGADVRCAMADGKTALHLALHCTEHAGAPPALGLSRHTQLVRALVAAGAELNAVSEGMTPLDLAVHFGYTASAMVLRQAARSRRGKASSFAPSSAATAPEQRRLVCVGDKRASLSSAETSSEVSSVSASSHLSSASSAEAAEAADEAEAAEAAAEAAEGHGNGAGEGAKAAVAGAGGKPERAKERQRARKAAQKVRKKADAAHTASMQLRAIVCLQAFARARTARRRAATLRAIRETVQRGAALEVPPASALLLKQRAVRLQAAARAHAARRRVSALRVTARVAPSPPPQTLTLGAALGPPPSAMLLTQRIGGLVAPPIRLVPSKGLCTAATNRPRESASD